VRSPSQSGQPQTRSNRSLTAASIGSHAGSRQRWNGSPRSIRIFGSSQSLADPVGDARTGGESPASLAVETDHVAPRAHEYPTVLRAGADRESGFGNRERAAGGRLLGDDSEPAGAVAGGDREAVSVALNDDRVGTGEPRDRLVAVGVVHEGGVVVGLIRTTTRPGGSESGRRVRSLGSRLRTRGVVRACRGVAPSRFKHGR